MAFVCFVYVCDVRHVDKRGWICFWRVSGGDSVKGTPSPFQGRTHERLPLSKFFYFSKQIFLFFSTHPVTSSIHPFFLSLRGFLFLCVYFPIRVSFRVSEGKKRGKYELIFLSYLCLCGYYALYSRFIFSFSVIFLFCISPLCCVFVLSFVVNAVFFADLPILLPSVGLSSLLCVIVRLGVFRGSEAKK